MLPSAGGTRSKKSNNLRERECEHSLAIEVDDLLAALKPPGICSTVQGAGNRRNAIYQKACGTKSRLCPPSVGFVCRRCGGSDVGSGLLATGLSIAGAAFPTSAGAEATAVVGEMVLGVPVWGSGRGSVTSVGAGSLILEVVLGVGRGGIGSIMLVMSFPDIGKGSGTVFDTNETRAKPGATLGDRLLVSVGSRNTSPGAAVVNVAGP